MSQAVYSSAIPCDRQPITTIQLKKMKYGGGFEDRPVALCGPAAAPAAGAGEKAVADPNVVQVHSPSGFRGFEVYRDPKSQRISKLVLYPNGGKPPVEVSSPINVRSPILPQHMSARLVHNEGFAATRVMYAVSQPSRGKPSSLQSLSFEFADFNPKGMFPFSWGDRELSTGEVVGIVIVCLAVLGAAGYGGYYLYKKRENEY